MAEKSDKKMEKKPLKVLLIEDNPRDARLIQEILTVPKDALFNTEIADRLSKGMEHIANGEFDVILLDLSLPDSQGIDTFDNTYAQAKEVPIIVLTGLDDEELALKAVREGAQDYLVKGNIDSNLLIRSVRYAIERKRVEKALQYRVEMEKLTTSISTHFINLAPAEMDNEINQSLQKIGEFVGVDRGYVFLFTENGMKMDNTHEWCAEGIERHSPKSKGLFLDATPWFRERIKKPETIHIPLVSDLPSEASAEKEELQSRGVRSLINVPLVYRSSIVGFLGFDSIRKEKTWTEGDISLLNMVGEIFVNALEQKRADLALQESNHHLEEALTELQLVQQQNIQQERLRALGQMASGIAHDFNNTLSPILSFSEMLLMHPDNLDDKEKVRRYLRMIHTAAEDAAKVVSRLREFYCDPKEIDTFLSVNLNQLVEQSISLTQPKWKDEAQANGKTIHIETDLQDVLPINIEEADFREALTNLIFNAVDAIPEKGTISFRTQPDGDYVLLELSDTGTGMTEEARQRCMDPFFTTKDQRGTGFGLTIVYSIIQRYKGTIVIESEWGKGTTFTLHIPVQKEQREEEKKEEVVALSRPLHVLVVEDEPLVCEGVITFLTSDGHTVETATNGHEGLEKFQAGRFDLVLTDRAMPEMSGDQLAVAIKEIEPNKPVILLTGFGDMMKNTGETPNGVDFIVNKPVTLAELRKALARVTENTPH